MISAALARYLNPWAFRREQAQRRFDELRRRDGDACRRCRRPIRFDLPRGHDMAAKIEQIGTGADTGSTALHDLCLTHGRCNAPGLDHTDEVMKRLRPARDPKPAAKPRTKRAA